MRKQSNPFQVRRVVLESGERLPILRERASGEPLYEPTLYALTQLRAQNLASATIDQVLRAIMVLCFFLKDRKVDLDERMQRGQFLTLEEVEALSRFCRLPVRDLVHQEAADELRQLSKVTSLERVRMRKSSKAAVDEVGAATASTRGFYVIAYLQWLVDRRMMDSLVAPHPGLSPASSRGLCALREHLPSKSWRAGVVRNKGFDKKTRQRLLEVVDPASPDNPWSRNQCRQRNQLVVLWLLHLGMRRGELLGIQISDIDFQRNEVVIARRADDVDDPRRDEPNTKTNDRILPISEEMAALARNYILKVRSQLRGARRHKYLLVANGTGAPLGKAAFGKIFVSLQKKCPDLEGVHPHLFRHTWNDNFTELMDREGISEERERKMRSVLMGWSPTSGSAATYTRRHVERKANEASLIMQKRSMKDTAG
jgi:integrase